MALKNIIHVYFKFFFFNNINKYVKVPLHRQQNKQNKIIQPIETKFDFVILYGFVYTNARYSNYLKNNQYFNYLWPCSLHTASFSMPPT